MQKRTVRTALILAALLAATSFSAVPVKSPPGDFDLPDLWDFMSPAELSARLDSLLQESSIPGAAVAIVSTDSVIWMETFGVANRQTGEPVTEKTHFCIGSCTKSFIGLGFLKLVEKDSLDLQTPLQEIIPEIEINNPWRETDPVRIIHLLDHTAGFDDLHFNWFYLEEPEVSLRQALEIEKRLLRVRWRPGTRFSYSSVGYTLAGYILEKLTKKNYQEFLKEAILDPIGMTTATIGRGHDDVRLLSVGYEKDLQPVPQYFSYHEPSGDLNASIEEMALFVMFMLNCGRRGDQQVISPASFRKIGKPTSTLAARAGVERGYAYGVGTTFRDGHLWYNHSGAVPGFYATYQYSLSCGRGFVFLFNQFAPIDYDKMIDLLKRYLVCRPAVQAPPAADVRGSVLKSYCGYYESKSPRLELIEFIELLIGGRWITCENDTLYQQDFNSDREALIPVTERLFRLADQPRATRAFTETDNGTTVFTSHGFYYEKTAAWKPIVRRTLVFGALLLMLSALVYSVVWIPLHLYKRIRNVDSRSKYLRMRILPLLAVASLIVGPLFISGVTVLGAGQATIATVGFFLSTLLFAALSITSLAISLRSFKKPVHQCSRIYSFVLSLACVGMTLYLGSYGLIGLRLWAY